MKEPNIAWHKAGKKKMSLIEKIFLTLIITNTVLILYLLIK